MRRGYRNRQSFGWTNWCVWFAGVLFLTFQGLAPSQEIQRSSSVSGLVWSTYFGGGGDDFVTSIDKDEENLVFIGGQTQSVDMPTSMAFDTDFNGSGPYYGDAFVGAFLPNGGLFWSTYFGGSDSDTAMAIAVHPDDTLCVAGMTRSSDFPVPNGFDTTYGGGDVYDGDAFLAEFDHVGGLKWSTYLGGSEADRAYDVAVDSSKNVYVAGFTASADFPATGPGDTHHAGGADAYVARYDTNGRMVWATLLGGSHEDRAFAIAEDGAGSLYVVGRTSSSDFPTTDGFDQSHGGGEVDTFVTKLNSHGVPIWSTYLGGSGSDPVTDVAADGAGYIYVTGATNSADFPSSDGLDNTFDGGKYDAFLTKMTEDGELVWSRYLGTEGRDETHGIALDANGAIWVTGFTDSTEFPGHAGDLISSTTAPFHVFASEFDESGVLIRSMLISGSSSDESRCIITTNDGRVCIGGLTQSADFPTSGAFDDSYNGGAWDGFVTVLKPGSPVPGDPEIAVDPLQLAVSAREGSSPADEILTVWNRGDGILEYEVHSTSAALVTSDPASGHSSGGANPHTISFETAALTAGTYDLAIHVTGNAANSHIVIPVTIKIEPGPQHSGYDIAWSTYLGGSGMDRTFAVRTDAHGYVVVAVETQSSDFPSSGAYDPNYHGGTWGDTAVVKFDAHGRLLWSTYLGGTGSDAVRDIAVDPSGNVIVVGSTSSADFPANGPHADDSRNGGSDAFVAKYSPDGALLWSTYYGGDGVDSAFDIAVDSEGNLYIEGQTDAGGLPGADGAYGGADDTFVVKLRPEGSHVWTKYIGGSGADRPPIYGGSGIAYDASDNVLYVSGLTYSNDFHTSISRGAAYSGGGDAFIVKMTPSGEMIWAMLLGGSALDWGHGVAVDGQGGVFTTGWTQSSDLPTPNGYDTTYNGDMTGYWLGGDIFVAKLSREADLLWATYLGGLSADMAYGIDTDAHGFAYISGSTASPDIPTPGGFDFGFNQGHGGSHDPYVAKFSPGGDLVWATYFGGSGQDGSRDVAIGPNGALHFVSETPSSDFPIRAAYDSTPNGNTDSAVTKLIPGPHAPEPVISVSPEYLSIAVEQYASTPVRMLEVRNMGTGTLDYEIDTDYAWVIEAHPPSGHSDGDPGSHELYFRSPYLPVGTYQLSVSVRGNAVNSPVVVPVTLTVTPFVPPMPNLVVHSVDAGPTAPLQLQPGDPLIVGALIENNGGWRSSPAWVEVWGSKTGGLQLDRFLVDSLGLPGLGTGQMFSWVDSRPLWGLPDGRYTVVYSVDRPGEVAESNERDNRAVVAGKRLLITRPQRNVDLSLADFDPGPELHAGVETLFTGSVRNVGEEPSGPFWIEFWAAMGGQPYPVPEFYICDSIYVENLEPNHQMYLSEHARRIHTLPQGLYTVFCIVDRDDTINEITEANNYMWSEGIRVDEPPFPPSATLLDQTGPDIVITSASFGPGEPTQLAPGSALQFQVTLENAGTAPTGAFWLEYWGSRDGGITLDSFLTSSEKIDSLAPGQTLDLNSTRTLGSVPDGLYTVVFVADRQNDVFEVTETNNRLVFPGNRLLTIRPETGANLRLSDFQFGSTLGAIGEPVPIDGTVSNTGTADSGPFWIEFWACPGDPDYPWLGMFVVDSIRVDNLASGEELDLSDYAPILYPLPTGVYAIIGYVDRLDGVVETDESDNYQIRRNFFMTGP